MEARPTVIANSMPITAKITSSITKFVTAVRCILVERMVFGLPPRVLTDVSEVA